MLKISPEKIAIPLQIILTTLSVNVNIPLVGKMHMSQRFLKKVILLYLLITEFLRGGIQLLPLFDLISIFIIFQYVFGLDEFSKRM
jgi:hypothetical protein